MANMVAQIADNSPEQCRRLAVGVNAALRGDTSNIGRLSCAAGQSSVTVMDKRCRAGRLAVLIPLNSVAAGLNWWLSSMTRDSMTFSFSPSPNAEALFGWALIGDGFEKR
ncbi:MAG: hypothetical protein IKW19_09885 [Akkermansia sp.]|nr:hypothetical protein [Akkermansia sp.]